MTVVIYHSQEVRRRDRGGMFCGCVALLLLCATGSPAGCNPSPVLGDVVVDAYFMPEVCVRQSKTGDHVRYHYNATLADGKTFDSR